jgi:hypothetical protein
MLPEAMPQRGAFAVGEHIHDTMLLHPFLA